MNKLTVDVHTGLDGSKFVYLDEVHEGYQQMIENAAIRNLTIFEVNGRYACPFETVLECSLIPSD